jgi:hypothetical protein
MTDDELMAYLVQCVLDIRFGEDITDDEFIAICKSIGSIDPEVLLRMTEMEGEPAESARALGGRTRDVVAGGETAEDDLSPEDRRRIAVALRAYKTARDHMTAEPAAGNLAARKANAAGRTILATPGGQAVYLFILPRRDAIDAQR